MTSKSSDIIIKLNNVWKIYHVGDTDINALAGMSVEIQKG